MKSKKQKCAENQAPTPEDYLKTAVPTKKQAVHTELRGERCPRFFHIVAGPCSSPRLCVRAFWGRRVWPNYFKIYLGAVPVYSGRRYHLPLIIIDCNISSSPTQPPPPLTKAKGRSKPPPFWTWAFLSPAFLLSFEGGFGSGLFKNAAAGPAPLWAQNSATQFSALLPGQACTPLTNS